METEKKDYSQRPKCPNWHNAWIWNTWWSVYGRRLTSAFGSVVQFMVDKSWIYSGTEDQIFHPVMQNWGFIAAKTGKNIPVTQSKTDQIFLTEGYKSDFMLLKFMIYADMVRFLNPVTNVGSQDCGMVKWDHVQQWSVGRQEGRRISTCQYTYSSSQRDMG